MRIETGALISSNIKLRNDLDVALEALRYYASQKHFEVVDGKTKLIDNGGVAEDALNKISEAG